MNTIENTVGVEIRSRWERKSLDIGLGADLTSSINRFVVRDPNDRVAEPFNAYMP